MLDKKKDQRSISFVLSSDLRTMERVLLEAEKFLRMRKIKTHIEVLLTLRELLLNAIAHGNKYDAAKTVRCSLEIMNPDRLEIVIEDEGNGFKHREVNMALPEDPRHVGSRGLALAKHLADLLEFNETGNHVRAVLICPIEEFSSSPEEKSLIQSSGELH